MLVTTSMLASIAAFNLLAFVQPLVQSEETVKFSPNADGPTQWVLEPSKDAWVKALEGKVNLDGYRVEAVMHVTETSVKAWRPSGEAYPDFEGYFKTKIQNSPTAKIQFKFGKKNRVVVFRIPNSPPSVGRDISLSVNMSTGEYYAINDVARDSEGNFNYLYLPIACEENDRFASFMASLYFSMPSDSIPVQVGQEFSVGINRYRVESIKPYKEKDTNFTGNRFMASQPLLTSIVIKKLEIKGTDQFLQGTVEPPKPKSPNSQVILDDKGNFVERTQTEMSFGGLRYNYPRLQQIAVDEKTQIVTVATNVNMKWLKTMQFSYNSNSKAWLKNVQIDFQ